MKNPLPPLIDNIGKRIAGIRKSKGFTQTQIADLIGINQHLVSYYETGRVAITADMLARFCAALKCSADDIIDVSSEIPKAKTSLRLVKRMNAIDALPEATKKRILKTIDVALEAIKMA